MMEAWTLTPPSMEWDPIMSRPSAHVNLQASTALHASSEGTTIDGAAFRRRPDMRTVIPPTVASAREPKPEWLKVRAPGSSGYLRLKGLMRGLRLHTVCEEARCPNIVECWNHGTATVMILGDVCTRACGFCAVNHGRPATADTTEPSRVAAVVQALDLAHVVITSVSRDDLADGGA